MRSIELTQSKSTMVDDDIYEELSKVRWAAFKNGKKYGQYYAIKSGARPRVKLHNIIMDCPKGFVIDHKDGDGLNNQRENLRISTVSQNGANRKISATKKGPQYLGVHYDAKNKKYQAFSNKDRVRYRTGRFNSVEECALAYNDLATKLHGEFARLNIIEKEACF